MFLIQLEASLKALQPLEYGWLQNCMHCYFNRAEGCKLQGVFRSNEVQNGGHTCFTGLASDEVLHLIILSAVQFSQL